jgi:hypothetical protein
MAFRAEKLPNRKSACLCFGVILNDREGMKRFADFRDLLSPATG